MFPQLKPETQLKQLPLQMRAEVVLLLIEAGRQPREVADMTGIWPDDAASYLQNGPFRRGDDFNSTRPKDEAE